MKIYFSKVPEQDVSAFGDEGLLGPNKDGDYFYNQVEWGTNPGGLDEVTISDGIVRSIPICVDTIPEMVVALIRVYNLKQVINAANNISEVAESEAEAHVGEEYNNIFGKSIPNYLV